MDSKLDLEVISPDAKAFGFVRVAAAVPKNVFIADVKRNVAELVGLAKEADERAVNVLVFPELCLTGYSCGDLFLQSALIKDAVRGLLSYADLTKDLALVSIVGLPLRTDSGKLFNVAAVVSGGKILGLVPKTYLPNYGEFYEGRYFASGNDECGELEVSWDEQTKIIFSAKDPFLVISSTGLSFNLGVTICEDDWRAIPPSNLLAMAGAEIICNLSASNELVTKANYRRERLAGPRSSDGICGYVYCSAGPGESTADLVFGGHCMIYENGSLLAERLPLSDARMIISEIDVEGLRRERLRENTWSDCIKAHSALMASYNQGDSQPINLRDDTYGFMLSRKIDAYPFVPQDRSELQSRCNDIIALLCQGLYQRLLKVEKATGKREVAIGISGGLDSTLAFLVVVKTFEMLGWDKSGIIAVTMPGPGTSRRTLKNAIAMIMAFGVTYRRIPIMQAVKSHLRQLGHEPCWQCLQCQNAQARERTQILFDLGFVIGTGDLSEAAQGWCTYNGDHMSSYNINCDVPKTLVKFLVSSLAKVDVFGSTVSKILLDILNTPISPELVKAGKNGEIGQKTEDEIGPYDLHDFFLYHIVRKGESPEKVFYLACIAFQNVFDGLAILKWLKSFYKRFFANQFKRDCVPNGPMIGTISLSPRGYWRMPSDAAVPASWLETLEQIESIVKEVLQLQ